MFAIISALDDSFKTFLEIIIFDKRPKNIAEVDKLDSLEHKIAFLSNKVTFQNATDKFYFFVSIHQEIITNFGIYQKNKNRTKIFSYDHILNVHTIIFQNNIDTVDDHSYEIFKSLWHNSVPDTYVETDVSALIGYRYG